MRLKQGNENMKIKLNDKLNRKKFYNFKPHKTL